MAPELSPSYPALVLIDTAWRDARHVREEQCELRRATGGLRTVTATATADKVWPLRQASAATQRAPTLDGDNDNGNGNGNDFDDDSGDEHLDFEKPAHHFDDAEDDDDIDLSDGTNDDVDAMTFQRTGFNAYEIGEQDVEYCGVHTREQLDAANIVLDQRDSQQRGAHAFAIPMPCIDESEECEKSSSSHQPDQSIQHHLIGKHLNSLLYAIRHLALWNFDELTAVFKNENI